MHGPHRFKEGRVALALGSAVRGDPSTVSPRRNRFSCREHPGPRSQPSKAAHPMAAQDRGTKACIPWGRLRSLCSLPHVLIPKVFSNQHPEPKASEDHFEFVYSLQRQHVFHLGVPPPPSEGQGHTLPPFNASISPLDHVAGCCLLRGAGVSVFSLHAASPR